MAFGSKVKKLCKRALRLPIMLEIVLMLIAAYCALNYAGIMCACLPKGVCEKFGLGTTVVLDPFGHTMCSVLDPLGHIMCSVLDPLGHIMCSVLDPL